MLQEGMQFSRNILNYVDHFAKNDTKKSDMKPSTSRSKEANKNAISVTIPPAFQKAKCVIRNTISNLNDGRNSQDFVLSKAILYFP
jgi:hypothetical protein